MQGKRAVYTWKRREIYIDGWVKKVIFGSPCLENECGVHGFGRYVALCVVEKVGGVSVQRPYVSPRDFLAQATILA